ncbi:PEP-CTERM sorting domain-containing protein [Rubellicoccus peritrichatus]|uniref:PEP-CTERM sorting domain-containing protein n=1 Tax=Rubellicoccus peritrichatus TaxID=3080537 RepID=A0AAQ3LDL6_9BACT|nr:PEP-CTERM sorting domain-containing protein [Puniceicoccus sp. CR14]WOO42474.1 PEP-CTERM sorting domain-containing protein [Puniceicoccus sp. CR14]
MKNNATVRNSLSSLLITAPAVDAAVVTYNNSATIGLPGTNALYWDIDGEVINTANVTGISDFTAGFVHPYDSADAGFFIQRGTNTTTTVLNRTIFAGAKQAHRFATVLVKTFYLATHNIENVGYDFSVNTTKFATGNASSVARFASPEIPMNTPVFIGFIFNHTDSSPDLFGWAEVEWNNSPLSTASLTIHRWAYEDSGAPITTPSAIPEPATTVAGLGALALGAAGLRHWRKRKKMA